VYLSNRGEQVWFVASFEALDRRLLPEPRQ
jgi:hypothetical protein